MLPVVTLLAVGLAWGPNHRKTMRVAAGQRGSLRLQLSKGTAVTSKGGGNPGRRRMRAHAGAVGAVSPRPDAAFRCGADEGAQPPADGTAVLHGGHRLLLLLPVVRDCLSHLDHPAPAPILESIQRTAWLRLLRCSRRCGPDSPQHVQQHRVSLLLEHAPQDRGGTACRQVAEEPA